MHLAHFMPKQLRVTGSELQVAPHSYSFITYLLSVHLRYALLDISHTVVSEIEMVLALASVPSS